MRTAVRSDGHPVFSLSLSLSLVCVDRREKPGKGNSVKKNPKENEAWEQRKSKHRNDNVNGNGRPFLFLFVFFWLSLFFEGARKMFRETECKEKPSKTSQIFFLENENWKVFKGSKDWKCQTKTNWREDTETWSVFNRNQETLPSWEPRKTKEKRSVRYGIDRFGGKWNSCLAIIKRNSQSGSASGERATTTTTTTTKQQQKMTKKTCTTYVEMAFYQLRSRAPPTSSAV